MKVSVILVAHNARALVRRCLDAVFDRTSLQELEVIVVDNASGDGTPEMVAEAFPRARLLRNRDNTGFAKACNQAWDAAAGEYVLWLNTDCFLQNDAIAIMAAYLDAHPEAGVVGARLLNEDGSYQPSTRRFLTLTTELFATIPGVNKLPLPRLNPQVRAARTATEPLPVPFVSGACLMFRRALHDRIGGLDERFFMYCEEEDFCRRAAAAGWTTVYVPAARAIHVAGGSASTFARSRLLYRSKLLYYRKHHSAVATAVFRAAVTGALALRFAVGAAARLVPGRAASARALTVEAAAGIAALAAGTGSRRDR